MQLKMFGPERKTDKLGLTYQYRLRRGDELAIFEFSRNSPGSAFQKSIENDSPSNKVGDIWLEDEGNQITEEKVVEDKYKGYAPKPVWSLNSHENKLDENMNKVGKIDHTNLLVPIKKDFKNKLFEEDKMKTLLTYDYRGNTLEQSDKMCTARRRAFSMARNEIRNNYAKHAWQKPKSGEKIERARNAGRYNKAQTTNPIPAYKDSIKDEEPWNERQGRFLAPRKWYQNSRRNFIENDQKSSQRRSGKYLSRRSEITNPRRRNAYNMSPHLGLPSLVFPRSLHPHHPSMIRVGEWNSPAVLDKVIQVGCCEAYEEHITFQHSQLFI